MTPKNSPTFFEKGFEQIDAFIVVVIFLITVKTLPPALARETTFNLKKNHSDSYRDLYIRYDSCYFMCLQSYTYRYTRVFIWPAIERYLLSIVFFLFVLFSKFYTFLIIVILQHRYFEFILLWLSFVCHELDNWEETWRERGETITVGRKCVERRTRKRNSF